MSRREIGVIVCVVLVLGIFCFLPGSSRRYNARGAFMLRKGEISEAVKSLNRAVELDPGNWGARYNLGKAYYELGYFGKALEEGRAALKLNPSSWESELLLSTSHIAQSDLEQGLEHAQRALEINEGEPSIHYNIGICLQRMGKLKAAETYLLEALERKPDYAKAEQALGDIAMGRENFENALERYEAVLKMDPDNVAALLSSGFACRALRDYEAAVKRFQEAAESAPGKRAQIDDEIDGTRELMETDRRLKGRRR